MAQDVELVDYDLDVKNLFNDFPDTDKDAFLYVRVNLTDEQHHEIKSTIQLQGQRRMIKYIIGTFLMECGKNELDATGALNGILAFFYAHREQIPKFREFLNMIEKEER